MLRRAQGELTVFTFKEGLLSPVAHDLRLRASGASAELEGENLVVRLPLDELRVEGVMRSGVLDPRGLSPAQYAEIERAVRTEVLHTDRFPEASYRGRCTETSDQFSVTGELELSGRRVALSGQGRRSLHEYKLSLELVPSRWGIAQYRALLGAIRLKDAVRVEVSFREAVFGGSAPAPLK